MNPVQISLTMPFFDVQIAVSKCPSTSLNTFNTMTSLDLDDFARFFRFSFTDSFFFFFFEARSKSQQKCHLNHGPSFDFCLALCFFFVLCLDFFFLLLSESELETSRSCSLASTASNREDSPRLNAPASLCSFLISPLACRVLNISPHGALNMMKDGIYCSLAFIYRQ